MKKKKAYTHISKPKETTGDSATLKWKPFIWVMRSCDSPFSRAWGPLCIFFCKNDLLAFVTALFLKIKDWNLNIL